MQSPGEHPASLRAQEPAPGRQARPPYLLHLVRSFDPAAGGASEGIRRLAESGLRLSAERGDSPARPDMELLSLDPPDADFVRETPFPVHALGPVRGHYGYTPRLAPWLRQNLGRFDGAVIHGLWQYHSFGAYQTLRGRLPYAVFPHGMLDPYFKRAFPLKHLKKQAYWLARERKVLRDAHAICFTTAIERDLARRTFWPGEWARAERSAVVSFGTSAPPGNPALQRDAFLARFPQLAGRRFFLFLSRIHEKKGCDLAIEALARLQASRPAASFDLVLAGPDEAGLRPTLTSLARARKIADRVHWTGMLEGDLKWGAFRAAEAFLLPSHQENFGVAAVEAMACGLPVLLSNQVNIWPEIAGDKAGIVNGDTIEGTLRSMETFADMTPEAREQMVANGLQCFAGRYDMVRTAQALHALFRA